MDKKDEQIEQKLLELEAKVADEEDHKVAHAGSSPTGLSAGGLSKQSETTDVGRDLQFFSGIGLILTGILLLFNHIRVGTGFFQALGMTGGGFGLLMVPLLVGIGWLFYDSKSRWGWVILAASCALIIFSMLSSIVMTFPTLSLLGLIMIMVPLALGGALLLKSMGGPKGLEQKFRESNLTNK